MIRSAKQSNAALFLVAVILAESFNSTVSADGVAIDKIYHPYVKPLEREFEFRWLNFDLDAFENNHQYRLGYGQSITSHWFTEFYVIAERDRAESTTIEAYEIEAKWQLTEQGEYAADWGLLFELERENNASAWEGATSLLAVKEWGQWIGAANASLIYEWGENVDDEFESAAAFQLRHRFSPALEPATELYLGQDTIALGPVIMGDYRLGIGKKLHWELGILAGLQEVTPDTTLRTLVEFEF